MANPSSRFPRLAEMGHQITIIGDWGNLSAPTAIRISEGVLEGGADPRRSRFIYGR